LLLAGAIDVGQLCDRWHLAQKADEIEAPLLGTIRPGEGAGVRGPAELAFDARNELLDRLSRDRRFLALNVNQGLLVLGRGEPDLDHAAHQDMADHSILRAAFKADWFRTLQGSDV
jgi:hypothetical protein